MLVASVRAPVAGGEMWRDSRSQIASLAWRLGVLGHAKEGDIAVPRTARLVESNFACRACSHYSTLLN